MNGVSRLAVVTRKRGYGPGVSSPLRVQFVAVIHEWYGSNPHAQFTKLKSRTSILIASPVSPPVSSLEVRGQGTFDLLSNEFIKDALAVGEDVDMIDNPGKDWVWMTDKD